MLACVLMKTVIALKCTIMGFHSFFISVETYNIRFLLVNLYPFHVVSRPYLFIPLLALDMFFYYTFLESVFRPRASDVVWGNCGQNFHVDYQQAMNNPATLYVDFLSDSIKFLY